ncbi:MAG: hypothetical protein WAX14_19295 [Rhodococcus sp. (in: high G+C Gram-positive bacteria)]
MPSRGAGVHAAGGVGVRLAGGTTVSIRDGIADIADAILTFIEEAQK